MYTVNDDSFTSLEWRDFLFVCVFGLFFFFNVSGNRLKGGYCVMRQTKHIRCEMWLRKVTKTVGETKGGREKGRQNYFDLK